MTTFIKLELSQITNDRLKRLEHKKLTLIAIDQDLLVFRVDPNKYIPNQS
jgi:hypothetical protein